MEMLVNTISIRTQEDKIMGKKLTDLVRLLPDCTIVGEDTIITDITYDSRKVEPGSLFVCLVGVHSDGHNFVEQAQKLGAVAVLVEKDVPQFSGVTVVKVGNVRQAMQIITPYFYDYPARKLRMIGVTGTNGKTTTTYLVKSILEQAGRRVGLIGTIQTMIGDRVLPVKNTTPDVIELQETLSLMVSEGIEYVVMEVSSHALALGRVAGCEYDVGIFTNLTQDHLDFHVTFEDYLSAKSKLFSMLTDSSNVKDNKTAVINADDTAAPVIRQHARCKQITYGLVNDADLKAADTDVNARGVKFHIEGLIDLPLDLKITGVFNVYNVLGAVGAALAEKIPVPVIREALSKFQSVPGRFELVNEGQPFAVVVDYAHTPDGLENILRTAKQFTKGRIITVFGCGGDRDRTKRPIMGKLAADYGDIVIATSDNPRSEDPEAILREIAVGIKQGLTAGKLYEIHINRHDAIQRAIGLAHADDTVIIAGKGHETYQILKDQTIPFDDREVARSILRGLK